VFLSILQVQSSPESFSIPGRMGRLRGGKAKRPPSSQATKNKDDADAGSGGEKEEAVMPSYKEGAAAEALPQG
jgi:hypothetical protein